VELLQVDLEFLVEFEGDVDDGVVRVVPESPESNPRQIVLAPAEGVDPDSVSTSTLLVSKRPPVPLELMAEDVQMGVRGATTTLLTSYHPVPHPLFMPP
jgi:hypothetical protein